MALPPQKFREMVFQLLYSSDMGASAEKDLIDLIMQELAVTRKNALSGQEKAGAVLARRQEIDKAIAEAATSYEFERIQSVERNILRLGVYELFFDEMIPPVVAISEAVRLAKKFGTPESASFVNAVMDAIYKRSKGENIDSDDLKEQSEKLMKSEQAAAERHEEPNVS